MAESTPHDHTTVRDPSEQAIQGFLSVSEIIDTPRLARLYTTILQNGPITGPDLEDTLGLPSSTLYTDLNRLVEIGTVEVHEETRPKTYAADPIHLTIEHENESFHVTPTLLAAIGTTETNAEFATFYERHGLATFAAAIEKTRSYMAGKLTRRMVAADLGIAAVEGIAMTMELEEFIPEIAPFDPYTDVPDFEPPFEADTNGL